MIHVVAVIKAKSGKRDAILSVAKENVTTVRQEDGCIEYILVVDAEFGAFQTKFGEDTFLVIEKWRDEDALKAHAAAPHMVSYAKNVKDWIESRVIHILDPVA
ncbi:MAG: putative quinol monooxygenase [Proteobacteria bacterium]|nr:putative quinol monooxygenase [Pseudomonadota bacterium]MDA1330962.1 putative quinol monooxygenase [Pseudomonadota bacterium]